MSTTNPQRLGSLIVLSGPSGAGKTTVYRAVLERHPEVRFSVSCTTRSPRPGERDGVDYHFLSVPEVQARIAAGEFLEHAEVHGNLYGTLRAEVEGPIRNGVDVLLDIDVQGARQVSQVTRGTPLAAALVSVFCAPPSFAVLQRRLEARGTDSPAVIAARLQRARTELTAWREYDWVIVNDRLEDAVAQLDAIVVAARCRTAIHGKEPWSI
jgi:guanylate kinase